MNVPFIDLGRVTARFAEDMKAAALRVLDHRQFILGKEVEAFEAACSKVVDGHHVIGMSSGTDALLAGLMALGVGPGDRVVTSPFSFFATAGTIARIGATPVFCDIEPRHYGLDPAALAAMDMKGVKAIVPVHLYGHVIDMDPIIAAARGVPVLEDAAQAIGARDHRGRIAGELSAIAAWSFFPTKNLGAAGDAGMASTKDAACAALLRMIRAHGQSAQYAHRIVGGNFRIDALQAAILGAGLPHLEALNAARRANARRYEALFSVRGLAARGVTAPAVHDGHSVHQYVVRIDGGRRDRVQADMKARGVATMVYYPIPFHLQECFSGLGGKPGDFPEAERAASEVLALPVFPGLTEAEQDAVVDALEAAVG